MQPYGRASVRREFPEEFLDKTLDLWAGSDLRNRLTVFMIAPKRCRFQGLEGPFQGRNACCKRDCRLTKQMRILALRYFATTRFHAQLPLHNYNELFAADGKALGPTPILPLETAL